MLQLEILKLLKTELQADIDASPKHEHVVGDRKILRYLRRTKFDLRKTCTLFREMLVWRKEYGTDDIYEKLAKLETLDATQFPEAEKVAPFPNKIEFQEQTQILQFLFEGDIEFDRLNITT